MSIVTRVCTICKTARPLDDFYIQAEARHAARNGFKKTTRGCRHCQKARMESLRKPRQEYVDQVKTESGCVDCGLHPEVLAVLEFDHRDPSQKSKNVSRMMHSGTWQAFVEEVAKCDIVCANCHRVRTITRKQLGFHFGRPRVTRTQVLMDQANGMGHIWDADMAPAPEKPILDIPLF